MFTKSRVGLIITILVLLVLSVQSVSATFTNGPENPGGHIVFRGEDIFFRTTEDFASGLTAIHNGDILEWCLTGEEPVVLMDFQDIDSPTHEARILRFIHGEDVPTTVWPFIVDWDSDLCTQFLAHDPIAIGTARFRFTDNDVFIRTYDNKNSNAWGWTSEGKLELYGSDGEYVHFNSVFRGYWDGVDEDSFKYESKINIK